MIAVERGFTGSILSPGGIPPAYLVLADNTGPYYGATGRQAKIGVTILSAQRGKDWTRLDFSEGSA